MLRAVDIFCGAGGSSAGARSSGVEIVAAVDMSPLATATYQHNFTDTKVLTSRLEDIDLRRFRRLAGEIDLLLASPECTSHTCARGSAPRDETSRRTAYQAIRFAQYLKPRWIVLENVVHIKTWHRYADLKLELTSIGYHLSEQVMDASWFGVPQTRRRLFLVGDRERPPPDLNRLRRRRAPCARSILDAPDAWEKNLLHDPRRAAGTLERARRGFKSLGKKASFLLVYYGTDGAGGWQSLDRPLRTITTVDRFALLEPSPKGPTIRMLQVPELKRAMGFDKKFELPLGTRRERIHLLGNGVCPPVMKAVVNALTRNC